MQAYTVLFAIYSSKLFTFFSIIFHYKAGGIDTRLRDLRIMSTEERTPGLHRDFFKGDNLIRYPILETYSAEELYRRSQVLQR